MAQISKYPISKYVSDRIFQVFIKTLTKLKISRNAQDLADDLFTPTEKIMLAKRLAIAFMLMKNYQYRNISKILRVSLATIGSVSLSLKYGHSGYQKILDEIAKEEKLEDFFKNVAEKLFSLPAKATKGGHAWRYLRKEIRKSQQKPF